MREGGPADRNANPSEPVEFSYSSYEEAKHQRNAWAEAVHASLTAECKARGFGRAAQSSKVRIDEIPEGFQLKLTGSLKQIVQTALPSSRYTLSEDNLTLVIPARNAAEISDAINPVLRDSLKLNSDLTRNTAQVSL